MSVYVFLGPTLDVESARAELDAVYLPPVSQGDVYRVSLRQPTAIAVVDGRFQDVPAVWHKEILWVLSHGVPVYGSASMGALRAAELAPFGMRGIGRIFEAYRDGLLEDDDEVAVAQSAQDPPVATSVAMVDVRATLDAARAGGVVSARTADGLLSLAKETFYPERTYRSLLAAARREDLPEAELAALAQWLPGGRVDAKRDDALQMLRTIRSELAEGLARPAPFTFEHTQFFERARRSAGTLASAGADALSEVGERASGVGRVTLEEVLDELRLDEDAYRRVLDRALLRCLALREAARTGATVRAAEVQTAADTFRRGHGLLRPEDVELWMSANHLTLAQFATLSREELTLARVAEAVAGELDIHLRTQLRVDGLYPALSARAYNKRRLLARYGLDDPSAGEVTDEEVLGWYVANRLGGVAPADLDEHVRSLGFTDRVVFLRNLRREMWFTSLTEGEPGEGKEEEASRTEPVAAT